MMQRMKTVAAFLAGAGAALTTGALAGPGFGGFEGPPFLHVMRELDLTPEQQALADDLRDAARADREEGEAIREAHFRTVTTELGKARPDAAKLHGVIDDALARGAKIAHARLDDFLALHATFTADQRQKLVHALEEGKERHEQHLQEHRPVDRDRRPER